jgi:hypothetical protein
MAIQIRANQIADLQIITGKIDNSAVTNGKLAGSIADSKLLQITTGDKVAGSAVQLAGSGGLENSSGLKIGASAVTNAMLAGSIANAKLTNDSVSYGGVALVLGGVDATPAFDLIHATNYPTSSLTGTITNAQLAGSIANAKLTNSSVSYGGVALSLGAVDATPAFNLVDATNYPTSSLTGTITNAQLAGSIAFAKLADSANIARLDQAETVAAVWAFGANIPTANQPSSGSQVANKDYVDAVAAGLDPKESVKAATTANITLSGTQTIDGISIQAADRVLVKNQSTGTNNGVYIAAAGAWARSTDFAAGDDEAGAYMWAEQGTLNGDTAFVCTNNKGAGVVGTNALVFSIFGRSGELTAGDGLQKSGGVLSVDLAANKGLEIIGGELAAKVNANTAMGVDANGISLALAPSAGLEVDSSQLRVKLDGATLARGNNGMKVADNAIGLSQAAFRFYREKKNGNNSATTFDLGRALNANFLDAVQVFRNGIFMELSGSPSDVDQFSVSATGGTGGVGRITIGAAPASVDVLYVIYPA